MMEISFFLIRVSLPDWEFLKTYLHTFFNDSFFYSIAFCSAHTLVFLAKQHKKLFSPIGIFRTRNFTFWRGKSLLYPKECLFMGKASFFPFTGCTTFFIILKNKNKNLFCFSQVCFGLRAVFRGFLAFRGLLQAKKSLKQPSGQNNLTAAKTFFCASSWLICPCISPKNIPNLKVDGKTITMKWISFRNPFNSYCAWWSFASVLSHGKTLNGKNCFAIS